MVKVNDEISRPGKSKNKFRGSAFNSLNSLAAWLGVLTACMMCAAALADDPPNLVKNPGFEEVNSDGFAKAWCDKSEKKKETLDDKIAHTGVRSIRLGVEPSSFVVCASADIIVKPSTKYMVTWWCKTEGFTRSRAYVWLLTNKAQRTIGLQGDQRDSREWTRHFSEYTTTAEETLLNVSLTSHNVFGTQTNDPATFCWFDDVGVYEGTFPKNLEAEYRTWFSKTQ